MARLAVRIAGLPLPAAVVGAAPVWHLYLVHTPRRKLLRQHLTVAGINTLVHHPVPLHQSPAYAGPGLGPGALPIAEALATACLSLPFWPGMPEKIMDKVALTVRRVLAGAA